ncbi:division/cell wall cluster transcriptional repressor MraZ [Sphingomonas sp. KR1UV-12]|uniref:Division/cell wall cluster transcriptional repressor MraZ n=1 Tax=Sphingomonas aurea TaxID=3063994 RepID=A0ABT9EF74_9SPHN|nr:division/cell wall cluster transcriptional repressor MraZ [Sphingomonas sp. KR1UV-12]MDP1025622.1 division/cell wall cluster transcriptional repressor MraZ [Sphingomonas sp. KR1UV-12]
MDRGRYQGDGIGLVDDKGRVAIPAALRATLAANAPKADGKTGGTIVIGAHQKNPCLVAYDPLYLDILAAQLDKREAEHVGPDGEFDYNIKRAAASGEAVPFDGSGRFIMPAFPRFYAGIGEHAFFYGVLDYIEIWDPKTLIETDGIPRVVKAMAAFHMQQKGIAL